ncbi:hypothetical protein BDW60DRAFT_169239 [Aspergillus nidulans var. acristatus]
MFKRFGAGLILLALATPVILRFSNTPVPMIRYLGFLVTGTRHLVSVIACKHSVLCNDLLDSTFASNSGSLSAVSLCLFRLSVFFVSFFRSICYRRLYPSSIGFNLCYFSNSVEYSL